jgi:predicted  nucleic acid-binding Zn-ribbon protein
MIPDLVEFGPIQRTRVSTACCISWPPLLAFAEVNRNEGGNVEGVILLALVSAALYSSSRHILGSDVNSRRWRGLMTTFGFGLAIPVVLASSSSESFLIIGTSALLTTIPPLLTKDGLERERRVFSERLKTAESRILELQSGNSLLQQPNSLLKTAREEGWKDPNQGIKLVSEAERETERILSFLSDIEEVKEQSIRALDRAEAITGNPGIARMIFDTAQTEMENGSLRIAENKFRESKSKAETLESHWQNAKDAIEEAETAISTGDGHLVQGLLSTLEDAKKAMVDEDPEYALAIVSEIPSQMGDAEGLMERARISLEDAENEISSSDSGSIAELQQRFKEANEALEVGNASLTIGLADGITRALRREASAKTSVQRALRQRKSIEDDIPPGAAGSEWRARLEAIASLADAGNWVEADDSMQILVSELESLSSRVGEAKEMLDFLEGDWKKLRNRLDSSGVSPENEMRVEAESALTDSEKALSEGRVESCLDYLGKADSAMEALRRLV